MSPPPQAERPPWLPLSIFGSGVLIALAIYSRPVAPLVPAAPLVPTASPPCAESSGESDKGRQPPANETRIRPPPPPAPQRTEKAVALAREAVLDLKEDFVKRCWQPSAARAKDPSQASYELQVAFDASGKQVLWAVQEERARYRADVGECLRRFPMNLRIPAPGALVQTSVQMELP